MERQETAMTTMTPRKKATRKPLRIRPELLPDSAKYGTFDGREYIMIPVEDFGHWYEDALDGAVIDHIDSLGETTIPSEKALADLGIRPAGKK